MTKDEPFLVRQFPCGCKVIKIFRSNKLPLFLIEGQTEGISESPFAAGQVSDNIMAAHLRHKKCPHIEK